MKKLFTLIFSLVFALTLQARDNGQFFKKLSGQNVSVENVEQNFARWFSLPDGTEWREVSRTTDYMGMERIEYRQYVSGIEVENSQILIHAKDGKVRSANGMVMELRHSPARIRQRNPIIKDDISIDTNGRELYLVSTKDGFRYAYKVLSDDMSNWEYFDAETQEVIKSVPTMQNFLADNSSVQVKGTTIYSGEVTMDASQEADGSTYLYDAERNIHTLNMAYLPTYEQLNEQGKLWQYFPQGNMPDDYNDATEYEISTWQKMLREKMDYNELDHLTDYILDYGKYINKKPGEDYYAYNISNLEINYVYLKDENGDLHPYEPSGDDWDDDDDDWDDDDDDWDDFDYVLNSDDDVIDTKGLVIRFHFMYGTDTQQKANSMVTEWNFELEFINRYPFNLNFFKLFNHIPREGSTLNVMINNDKNKDIPFDTLAVITFVPDESGRFEFSNDRISIALNYQKAGDPAADIHWGMAKTLDFYKEVFDRNSYDGNGSPVYNLLYNLPPNAGSVIAFISNNAAALATNEPYPMLYGLGGMSTAEPVRPVVELSLMAHEFTHIVTGLTAKLVYKGEPGALNESFSDIMGISVKKYVTNTPDWYIGENIGLNMELNLFSNIRNMADPKNSQEGELPCPDTYEGEFWIDPTSVGDNGGLHSNSGVQNKWYFLLTDGEEGTNDHGFAYNVEGIGIEKSRQIAYLTLTSYATQESDYAAIRMASQEAAEVLYGANSKELKAVADAWDAVGVAESDITGIEKMYFNEGQAGRIFDLQGRMLNELPTKCGVYIVDGKKVIVK